MIYLMQGFFIWVFYLFARPCITQGLFDILVLFLLASLFDFVGCISKIMLKGYFTSKENHRGKNLKTKFSLAVNPLMIQ